MYKDIFTQIGLNPNEAIIYEYLLKNGESPAGIIIKKTPIKRGVVYNTLADLGKKGLILQKNRQKIAYFRPEHPEKLRSYIENKENEVSKAKNTLEGNIPQIISDFNLSSNKPGIRFFEGREGIKKVLADTLTSKELVYTFTDIEALTKYMEKENTDHAAARKKVGLKKKIIFLDSPFAREYLKNYYPTVTEFKLIDNKLYPFFGTVVEIYDNKVAYISLSEKDIISMIINDKNIYQFHRSVFEFIWARASSLPKEETLSKAQ